MRSVNDLAWSLHPTGQVDRFAIGDGVYTLRDLKRIQDQEEQDAFIARHRNREIPVG